MSALPILSVHAKKRICERFNVVVGGEQKFFEFYFKKSEKVAALYNDKNNIVHYYTVGNIIFVVDPNSRRVTTVEPKNPTYSETHISFKARIQAFIKAEIDRATSAAHAAESFFAELDEDIRAELPELQAQLKRARALPKRLALMGRIAALEMRIAELPAEIKGARSEARREINGALAHY